MGLLKARVCMVWGDVNNELTVFSGNMYKVFIILSNVLIVPDFLKCVVFKTVTGFYILYNDVFLCFLNKNVGLKVIEMGL